ncbi:TPR-like protein [Suillus lakei]|nr:TPR-like protein [Suillus lakei]
MADNEALQIFPPNLSQSRCTCRSDMIERLHDRFPGGVQTSTDESIERHRAALARCPPGHPDRPGTLSWLAIDLLEKFDTQSALSDANEAIEHLQAAVLLYPPDHPHRPRSLNELAISLHSRFERRGVMSDLDEAIEHHRAALETYPHDHCRRSRSLTHLATSLQAKFKQQGVLSDLSEAIGLHRAALLLRPPCNPDLSTCLNNLAKSLRVRFEERGDLSDIDEAIKLHRAALELCPSGDPDRSMYLNTLALDLQVRFEHRDILSDLDEAIELHRAALLLHAPSDSDESDLPGSLNNLGVCLQHRFRRGGVLSDLNEAIELHEVGLALCSSVDDISHLSASLNNLANGLQARFKQGGVLSDLDEAIEHNRAAVVLLLDRSSQRDSLSDLDEAIELYRAALEIYPRGHCHRYASLAPLASGLQVRFQKQGVLSDLDEAIELHRAALLLYPPDHRDRCTSLISLANNLQIKFEQRGVMSDLDESIALHRAALELRPLGILIDPILSPISQSAFKPDSSSGASHLTLMRPLCSLRLHWNSIPWIILINLRVSIILSSAFKGNPFSADSTARASSLTLMRPLSSIELHYFSVPPVILIDLALSAISLAAFGADSSIRASYLTSMRPFSRFASLNNLAITLQERFEQRSILSDIDEAIELHRAGLVLHPPNRLNRSVPLRNLADALYKRFQLQGLSSDLDETFSLYSQLSHHTYHGSTDRDLRASRSWIACAEETNHSSALVAYQTALKFLDRQVAILSSSSRHFDVIRQKTCCLAMNAFSCSLRHGALTTAVELVEQGRAVFWTQLGRFRTPLDDLSMSCDTGAALAEEFTQLSSQLRNMFDQPDADQSSENYQLTVKWDDVILRIRTLPGFSRFLLPPLFSDLQKAADDGPVIVVNASHYSCDALIILSARNPVHVPLHITRGEVSELSSEFQSLTEGVGSSHHQLELQKIVFILRKLWLRVVGPIVQALSELVHRGSRIWWCPTAEFTQLPLHAAGPYEKKNRNLSHFYISSYTPTLAALIRARQQFSQNVPVQHFVAIGQANPEGGRELRFVAPELAIVGERVAPVMSFTSLKDSDATWLHMACHGKPNREDPFESSFAMRDGPLMIKDIIRSDWQNPEFAFLSACHTTVGDKSSFDESIHLAAAMQFSGFRSVIGSMWSVDDKLAGQIVSAFYDNMVDESGRLDCKRAAVALHKAVKSLRKKIPLEQQILSLISARYCCCMDDAYSTAVNPCGRGASPDKASQIVLESQCSAPSKMVRQAKQTPEEKKETQKRKTTQKKKVTETGVWPCKIDGCNKQFAREADLKRHQRTTKLHSVPGLHNGVIIEPTEVEKKKGSTEPRASGSQSHSRSPSPSSPGAENLTDGAPPPLGALGGPQGPHSYYRQHTMPAGAYMPPPLGVIVEGQYPPTVGLPTSSARLHQATWPPGAWIPDGSQPPPMPHMGYPHPAYYSYYRGIPHPPPPSELMAHLQNAPVVLPG